MSRAVHITYSGPGGMTQAVLTLLAAAQHEPGRKHAVLFYGTEEAPGALISRCESLGVETHLVRKAPGNDLPSLVRLFAILQQLRPDIVYSHMTQPLPSLLCYRFAHPGCRVISIEHHSNALKSRQDWLLSGANHLLTDHSIYLTPQYREEIRQHLGRLFRPRKVSVIPNGLDTDRFRPLTPPPVMPPLRIGMVARMVPGKDFATLLRAFKLMHESGLPGEIRLQLAGDGPDRAALSALSRDLAIHDCVDFLGEIPQEALIRTMQSWQIFVLSTLGETMSRSIMEAQSIGLPVVSTRVPGVTASVESGKTGVLVAPANPEEMAVALRQLAASPALRAELGRQAREQVVHRYSAAEIWRRYGELTQSLFSN